MSTIGRNYDVDLAPTHITDAYQRMHHRVCRTPVLQLPQLNEWCACTIWIKCENLQWSGSFKLRGASHAIACLTDQEKRFGVATHSSGNHGRALAVAAGQAKIPCTVVMPENAVASKISGVQQAGAEVIFCKATQQDREDTLADVIQRTGATLIHPYDDHRIICGQGTAALELLQEQPDLDTLIVPVGGGGLCAGTLLAARGHSAALQVLAAEPEQANDCAQSWQAGKRITDIQPDTIADGLRAIVGERNFSVFQQQKLAGILTISEDEIISAMRFVLGNCGLVIEPSSATVLAALRKNAKQFANRRLGAILSGGNIDIDQLPW